jgi:hypothetical protein
MISSASSHSQAAGKIIIQREFSAICQYSKVSKELDYLVRVREVVNTGDSKGNPSEDTILVTLFKKKRLLSTSTIALSLLDEIGPIADLIASDIADTLKAHDVELLSDLSDLNGIIKYHYHR